MKEKKDGERRGGEKVREREVEEEEEREIKRVERWRRGDEEDMEIGKRGINELRVKATAVEKKEKEGEEEEEKGR